MGCFPRVVDQQRTSYAVPGRHNADARRSPTDLLRVRSREAGITERTASLRHRMREDREQTARRDAVEAGINAAYRTRWHYLGGIAALCALTALFMFLYNTL